MKKLLLVLVVWVLGGCSVKLPKDLEPQTAEALRNAPACDSKQSCESLMELAQIWVNKNTAMRIQSATNVVISTYDDATSKEPSFNISKEPIGAGRFHLVLNVANGFKDGEFISSYERELKWRLKFNNDIKSMSN